MIPTRFLYQLAEYEGITIEWREMERVQGIYLNFPEARTPVIGLAKSLHSNERLLRCVLAHELGHHFLTAGHPSLAASSTSYIYTTKNEHLATKWAVDLLVPTDHFLQCIKDGMDGLVLADYFYVTHDFIRFKSELILRDERYSSAVAELRASYNVVF